MSSETSGELGPITERSVLVVEDDPGCRDLVALYMAKAGYRVTSCESGPAALALVIDRGLAFDLALVDVALPGMNGLEVVRRLRAHGPTRDLPILCVSARVSNADHQDALQAGCDDYLRKPYKGHDLFRAIEGVYARRRELHRFQARYQRFMAVTDGLREVLARGASREATLQTSAAVIADHLDAPLVAVWRGDDRLCFLHPEASGGAAAEPAGSAAQARLTRFVSPFLAAIRESAQPLLSTDLGRDPRAKTADGKPHPWPFNALAGYPVRVEGRVEATIVILSRTPFEPCVLQELATFVDLLERGLQHQHNEAALRRGDARYRSLVLATSTLTWSLDPHARMTQVSPSWGAFTGQQEAQNRRLGWLRAIHPDDRLWAKARWREAIRQRALFEAELRLRGGDGAYRYFWVRGVPILAEDGTIGEWLGACTDISERKRAEEALRATTVSIAQANGELQQQQALLRTHNERVEAEVLQRTQELEELSGEFRQQRLLLERILHNLPAAVAVWDADLVYRMVNPVYGKCFKDLPVDHFIGKHLFHVFPEAEAALKDLLHHVLETGEVRRETSFSFGFEQGGVRHGTIWDFELHPLRNDHGAIDGVLALAFEVSERVKMEQALEKKSQLIASMIDHLPALVGSIDHGGHVRWLNDAGMRLFGLSGELPAELTLPMLFPGLAGEEGRLCPLIEAGLPGSHPAVLAASPHQPHAYYDLVFLPMRQAEDGEAGVLLFGFDVSARVENERLVRERVQALEAASALKDEFIATVSHELRTPLTVIGNVGSILAKGRAGLLNGKQTELTGLMQTQIKRLNSLIDDLLDFQRLEGGSIAFQTMHVDVCALLEEIAGSFASVVEEKAIAFHVALPSRALCAGLDPHRFTQAVLNLLSNAVKFTPRGGAITLSAERRGAEIWVSVQDTGIGIHPDDQQRVFEKFTQVHSGLDRQHGGSGLGLAITRRLVEKAADGRIWVESEPGVGSIFRIALPLDAAAEVAS